MALTKAARSKISSLVQAAKRLLLDEVAAQLAEYYGIRAGGVVLPVEELSSNDAGILHTAGLLRRRLDYLKANIPDPKKRAREGFEQLVREQAFTILNRFASLRLAEERGIIRESIRQGYNSEGFLVFDQLTGGSKAAPQYERYRWYLHAIFDELAQDLPSVFSRFSPYALLFPAEDALLQLLALINDEALALHREEGLPLLNLWQEDETIGWMYQYYNSREEIKAMRDASNAPRNSRELAVRNQFFTPRYVVQFLTDNSLGRIWYEMNQGQTVLTEGCEYLVRQPNEVFLQPGEKPPVQESKEAENKETGKQGNNEPVYIDHRPLKDPRDLTMIDPACGSMHFGLYAFDLYEKIYLEAWDRYPGLLADLRDKMTRQEFERLIPSLIIRYNIHGVDIDPRAVQIAGLSLWLRAQRSYQRLGLPPAERPPITRANLVCAEPMPGDKGLLEEFLLSVDAPLRPLIRTIWDKMQLAGETGLLLKIEEELKNAIAQAREEWAKYQNVAGVQGNLFEKNAPAIQLEFDQLKLYKRLKPDFFEQAEELVLEALERYAETAANGEAYSRHLFAEDTARGFAFIDLCRKRYDVVLMNPPFGAASEKVVKYLKETYLDWNFNLFCCFTSRALEIASWVGSITDRAYMLKTSYDTFRWNHFINSKRIRQIIDLGWEVLDANVEVNLQVFCPFSSKVQILNILDNKEKGPALRGSCLNYRNFSWIVRESDDFKNLPDYILSYDLPNWQVVASRNGENITVSFAEAKSGLKPGRVDQFVRLLWEVPENRRGTFKQWNYFQNGGPYSPFYYPTILVVYYESDWKSIKAVPSSRITGLEDYWIAGISYGKRTDLIYGYPMPAGQIFSNEGMAVFPKVNGQEWMILAMINSTIIQDLMNFLAGQHKAHSYFNKISLLSANFPIYVCDITKKLVRKLQFIDSNAETSLYFTVPPVFFVEGVTMKEKATRWQLQIKKLIEEIELMISECDDIVSKFLTGETSNAQIRTPQWDVLFFGMGTTSYVFAYFTMSYLLGVLFGRWDIRNVLSGKLNDSLPSPFEELPAYSPGMLKEEISETEISYVNNLVTETTFDGIIFVDKRNSEGVQSKIRQLIRSIWEERSGVIEEELSFLLNVNSLDQYFGDEKKFFENHLSQYSRGKRQAPIYWHISSLNASYLVWLYYPKIDDQTLYKIINNYINPKLLDVENQIAGLIVMNNEPKKSLNDLRGLKHELLAFKEELLRIAALPYYPNHDDGVLITAAPLHRLFRHPKWRKATEECWRQLEAGEYDWAHLAYAIWPERVREKCKTDLSMAIAHGLEEICEVETQKSKKK